MGGVITEAAGLIGLGPNNLYAGRTAPGSAVLTPSTTTEQQQAAVRANTQASAQQQDLVNQLSGQGGLQTQNAILAQQQALANQLSNQNVSQAPVAAQQALSEQLTVRAGAPNTDQQALANQLMLQSQGQGPNPAQEQYKQNINAGTQAAAGTISSQKGISPALAAELVARQQGGANQNAASNAAQLQAQQQLNAQGQLQAQQGLQQTSQMQNIGQLQSQQTLQQQQAQQAFNQRAATQQALANQQSQMQGVAAGQIGNQQNAIMGLNQIAQGNQGQMLNAEQAYQQNMINMQGNVNSAQAGVSAAQQQAAGQIGGGALQGIGSVMSRPSSSSPTSVSSGQGGSGMTSSAQVMAEAEGGIIKKAKGGLIKKKSPLPDHLKHVHEIYHGSVLMAEGGDNEPNLEDTSETKYYKYKKDENTGKLVPEEPKPDFASEISKGFTNQMATGGPASYQKGAMVSGKPKVNHNSYSNDTVKALLSPGEVVIPLDVMNSKDPVSGAAKFVQALLEKKKGSDGADKSDFHAALSEAIKKRGKK